jgi:hypothetical protein
LKNGETSVMAQWAVGNYINAWDKLFENKIKRNYKIYQS